MIHGPTGDERLDLNFAWVRQALTGSSIDQCMLKFDYRHYFPKKDVESAVEALVENIEADIAQITALGARLQKHASAPQQ